MKISACRLENLYEKYNCRRFVHPDPLEVLYRFEDLKDREVVGFIAACLAYGRVEQILTSVNRVLDVMGSYPAQFLKTRSSSELDISFKDFKHRFSDGSQLSGLLLGLKNTIDRYGSLYECFESGYQRRHENILPALDAMIQKILSETPRDPGHLIAIPCRGSACKRLHLFLRWMIRKDRVDPGGWEDIHPAGLIVPLDVHMHRICVNLGMTERKQPNLKTALEVTAAFKTVAPNDPVRYDFVLSRFGIRKDLDPGQITGKKIQKITCHHDIHQK